MKVHLKISIVMMLLMQLASTLAYASEKFTLDPNHTYILWNIKHFGFSTQVGKAYASGTLILDKAKPENSSVNATIKVADMATGLPELDKHLKGKLFFEADKHPTATFVSNKVVLNGEKSAAVDGVLTLHGVSKPVVLAVTLTQSGINPISDNKTVGFTANANIKRSDFGMKTLLPGLGDDVLINIEVEAYQPQESK